jgi:HKD family nuclease
MDLILLPEGSKKALEDLYERALQNAVELYIVSAYLTEWDPPSELNAQCKLFRLIVGRDFGITRKDACRKVMKWLPSKLKNRFMVAEEIEGFHPKAMFWREAGGSMHALVGPSNLTRAAFSTNHEANVYQALTSSRFEAARDWVRSIEPACVAVSEDWLDLYQEAPGKVLVAELRSPHLCS